MVTTRKIILGTAVLCICAGISGCFTEHTNQRAHEASHHGHSRSAGHSDTSKARSASTTADKGGSTHQKPSNITPSHAQPTADAPSTANTPKTTQRKAGNDVTLSGTVVSLGDSITYGFNLPGANPDGSTPSPDAYPSLLGQMLHMHVINLGVPRWTTEKLIAALKTRRYQAALQQASVVTVDIGSNDLLHAFSGVLAQYLQGEEPSSLQPTIKLLQSHIAKLPSDLSTIIRIIRSQTDAPIILTTIYDPAPDQTPMHAFTNPYIIAANRVILQTAAAKHTLLYDAYDTVNHQQWTLVRVMNVDIHPTIAGQKALAAGFLAVWQHPSLNQPTRYAITLRGATVHESASQTSRSIGEITGFDGCKILSENVVWARIDWHGRQGFVLRKDIQEIVRYASDEQFHHATLWCTKVAWKTSDGDAVSGFAINHQVFVPVSELSKLVQGTVRWNNAQRTVLLSANPTPALASKRLRFQPSTDNTPSTIDVRYMGIGVRIDGALVHLTAQPFSYQRNIYVPINPVWTQLGGALNPLNGRFTNTP